MADRKAQEKTEATGNPVFDHLSDDRERSKALQGRLLRFGLADVAVGVLVCALAGTLGVPLWIGLVLLGAGVLLMLTSLAWGWFWRGRMRDGFRSEHGPQDS